MDNNFKRAKRRFVKHMHKTYKNKLTAAVMVLFGLLVMLLCENGVYLILALIFGIPLFFAKEDLSKPYYEEKD